MIMQQWPFFWLAPVTPSNSLRDVFLGVVLGGVFTVGTAVWIEWLRRPRLRLRIIPPIDVTYDPILERPARRAKWPVIAIENKSLPLLAKWMSRSAAMQCHGTMTFHYLDGHQVFGEPLEIRW